MRSSLNLQLISTVTIRFIPAVSSIVIKNSMQRNKLTPEPSPSPFNYTLSPVAQSQSPTQKPSSHHRSMKYPAPR
ncbi:Uncharacterized protein HZ326_1329 [Fusarium oxysporum f. sp. albedinis]|nr:Uncharacterized protein HZ326_1329 [Fusarium oxysporum f. sp. albedinis]